MLSLVVRKVLLQLVLTVIPMFILANCLVPKTVTNNFNKEFHHFLWGKRYGAYATCYL